MNRDFIFLLLLAVLVLASAFAGYSWRYRGPEGLVVAHNPVTSVACGSHSMGLAVDCSDLIFADRSGELLPGFIYVFRSPYDTNETVIHRLVACFTIDDRLVSCESSLVEQVMFKGDANAVPDSLVNKSAVLYRVQGVVYQ